jgi:hypothetical protein
MRTALIIAFGLSWQPCFALSGLIGVLTTFTRRVAPGWFVFAPSGRVGTVVLGESRFGERFQSRLKICVWPSAAFAPKEQQQTSLGQRPGLTNQNDDEP